MSNIQDLDRQFVDWSRSWTAHKARSEELNAVKDIIRGCGGNVSTAITAVLEHIKKREQELNKEIDGLSLSFQKLQAEMEQEKKRITKNLPKN
jgi:hypothetical protein